ncbi:MAG: histone deacetylase family protein [Anaerolineae bacterium]|nr:histone deacetylase family protein [Anaerolineae bacterium]
MHVIYSDHHKTHTTNVATIDGVPFVSRELPARAEVILLAVREAGLGPITAPVDHGLAPVLAVHDPAYVSHLKTVYQETSRRCGCPIPVLVGTGVTLERAPEPPAGFFARRLYYTYDYEDPIFEGTWEAAYWSAQCALTAADVVRGGERAAYAVCRPPGHHAMVDQYGGFCYLNNVAIAARSLQAEGPVAILDIDYHHGNGTQAIFYADPQVFYGSLHADPGVDYPFFWGRASERGAGPGWGTNLNVPLPIGTGDAAYLEAFEVVLQAIQAFGPQYLLVSLGLDAAAGDPIGKFHLTRAAFVTLGRRIAALGLPTVLVQEGGYNLDTLGDYVTAVLSAFP